MRYAEYPPPAPLESWIECLWTLSAPAVPAASRVERVLPDGCVELIVHLGDPFAHWSGPGAPAAQPRSLVVGQITSALLIQPLGVTRTLGVRFRPAGAYPFLGAPLDTLTGRQAPLDALWGADAARLEEALAGARDDAARVALLSGALARRLARGRAPHPGTLAAVRHLLGARGRCRVADAGRRAALSPRQLERRFRAEVGLAPKTLARIVRFQALLSACDAVPEAGWADLALEHGFADQTHLIREFRDLAGATPAGFGDRATELTRLFAARERLGRYLAAGD